MKYFNIKVSFKIKLMFLWFFMFFQTSGVLLASDENDQSSTLEVFVSGKRYDSLKDYKEQELNKDLKVPHDDTVDNLGEIRGMFDNVLRTAKQAGGLKLIPAKIKTIYFNKDIDSSGSQDSLKNLPQEVVIKGLTEKEQKQLNQVGFNFQIHQAISDFAADSEVARDRNNISDQDLEHVLEDSFSASNSPLLLISNNDKLRVMALEGARGKVSYYPANSIQQE